jgi:thiamine kinase-like enzyme
MKYILLAIFAYFFNIVKAEIPTETIDEIISVGIPKIERKDLNIKELKGGLSGTCIYKIESPNKSFVLRLHLVNELNSQDILELFSLVEASKLKISPNVYYVSANQKAVLMEFIDQPTLTLEVAKKPENIIKMASVLNIAHQITGHPLKSESLISKAIRCHEKVLSDNLGDKEHINKALEIIINAQNKLSTMSYTKVNVHGDLNPRNIFVVDNNILLIDWAETTLEDPFYDLSFFSLKLGYENHEENLLLTSYLGHVPTNDELKRFDLHKNIHQAFWSLTNLYLANVELKKNLEFQIDKEIPLKSWELYQKMCANCVEELNAQYFYDLSRLNYMLIQ